MSASNAVHYLLNDLVNLDDFDRFLFLDHLTNECSRFSHAQGEIFWLFEDKSRLFYMLGSKKWLADDEWMDTGD